MSKIKLNLPYKIIYPEGQEPKNMDKEYSEITKGYIEFAVASANASGLSGTERRTFARIQNKIDEAIENESYVAEMEDKDHYFVKKAFMSDKCKFNSALAKYVVLLEDEIQSQQY